MSSLAWSVSGSGPALIALHGLASARTVWNPIAARLAAHFTLWQVDLPGHGDSPHLGPNDDASPRGLATAVADFAAAQGIERPHLVGNSLGGFIALEWARMYAVASVTALCPAGLWEPLPRRSPVIEFNQRASRLLAPIAPAVMAARPLRAAFMASASERAGMLQPQTAVDAVIAQTKAQGFSACYAAALQTAFTDEYGLINPTIPVTVAFGDRDRVLPPPRLQRRSLAPAHARWETLYRCGHVPMWDVPEVTTRLILDTAHTS